VVEWMERGQGSSLACSSPVGLDGLCKRKVIRAIPTTEEASKPSDTR
jgi:hypothetical protein